MQKMFKKERDCGKNKWDINEKRELSPFVLRGYQYSNKGLAEISFNVVKRTIELKLMNSKEIITDTFFLKLNSDFTLNPFSAVQAIITAYWVQELRKEIAEEKQNARRK